ncbi:TrbI F-type domain-containing protein [Sphingorhabdus buctiana]|uniref:TrbI F-type domain-containing protein n=1 Tax=Sphingorhabdus buctiana TaxID=1508805 RepID=A0ABW4M8G7_9SPHN
MSASKPRTPVSGDGPLFEGVTTIAAATTAHSISWVPVAAVCALVCTGLWGAWVTRELVSKEHIAPMARIQLSTMVGEYVQAQARSATPPDQVTAETKAFMAEVEGNLKARGQKGQIILVGEAVLAGDVPDITAEVRKQVFAKVKMPQPAQAQAASVMGAMQQAMADPAMLPPVGIGNGPRN